MHEFRVADDRHRALLLDLGGTVFRSGSEMLALLGEAEVGAALGRDWPIQEFMHTLYALCGDDIIRPEAATLIADARAAGAAVGFLTNDLRAFHGETAMPVLAGVDMLLDGSVTGVLKPDPRAYALAVDELGHAAGDIVFVDDMPWNITGARKAGMIALELDLRDPAAAFTRARAELGLEAEAA